MPGRWTLRERPHKHRAAVPRSSPFVTRDSGHGAHRRHLLGQHSHRSSALDAATTKPRNAASYSQSPTVEQLAVQVTRIGPAAAADLLARHDQAIIHDVL